MYKLKKTNLEKIKSFSNLSSTKRHPNWFTGCEEWR